MHMVLAIIMQANLMNESNIYSVHSFASRVPTIQSNGAARLHTIDLVMEIIHGPWMEG